ncbi:MAG: 3D-(3,5/4)-trihydroxycyclohexane-1,2-dione acylhydrolase (decyclizing) [Caulobacteraceae bacterium]
MRLTAAQALVRALASQRIDDGGEVPFFAGVGAIFGHGNVAALGEALHDARDRLPVFRAHNEQAMGHAAVAYAKAARRRRAMVCTTSIGPGATNLVTAAAAAFVSRLPVLLIPGDVFASRAADPVLQQIEAFDDATASVNDCLRPVSRWFDRIARPEQLLSAVPRAMSVLTDPAACGPVTLAFCQDVQAEAFDWPEDFFAPRLWPIRRPPPEPKAVDALAARLRAAKAPLLIAGGGVAFSGAGPFLAEFCRRTGVPFAETQAGKGSVGFDHPGNLGGIGVTGAGAANEVARRADLVVGVGTRLADFTTGSRALFSPAADLVQINIASFDAVKMGALAIVADAGAALEALISALGDWRCPASWREEIAHWREAWASRVETLLAPRKSSPRSDAEVIGAIWRAAPKEAVVVAASGGLPGELHRLWRVRCEGGYQLEYGFSCMGWEIAGGLGVKLAMPDREVVVLVGDGAYLMMNSEIATAVAMGLKLVIVVLDNRGFGCIERLQTSAGGASFNNLLAAPKIDFTAHAQSLGAQSRQAAGIADLEGALAWAFAEKTLSVVVIETDPAHSTAEGGAWWDVAPPEVSERKEVRAARKSYEAQRAKRATRSGP